MRRSSSATQLSMKRLKSSAGTCLAAAPFQLTRDHKGVMLVSGLGFLRDVRDGGRRRPCYGHNDNQRSRFQRDILYSPPKLRSNIEPILATEPQKLRRGNKQSLP